MDKDKPKKDPNEPITTERYTVVDANEVGFGITAYDNPESAKKDAIDLAEMFSHARGCKKPKLPYKLMKVTTVTTTKIETVEEFGN